MAKSLKSNSSNGGNLGFEQKLWQAADKLRSNMDAAEYKHVVLGLIFLKYISDAFKELHKKLSEDKMQGADPEDPDEYRAENVFWVPKEARWDYLQKNAKKPNIGKLVDDAMDAIEKDNQSLKGVLPKNYARPALDKARLGELIDLVGTIGLGDAENRSKDILGRVYEYFLGQFAAAEGKKGGQFYTPKGVVKLLVFMIEPFKGRIFDPCGGSGGMFVQSEKFVEAHGGRIGDIAIYGQESNQTTWRLCKMNLAIRGIDADIQWGDSFINDQQKDLKADFILANPPFNDSDWKGELLREDARWKYGVPSAGNANFAWVQHFIHHLSLNGVAAFVLAGISLSSESELESSIRKGIIEEDLVDCIVNLPEKLFYTTPIPPCIWVLNRNKNRKGERNRKNRVLFIDASKYFTNESRTHNLLTDEAIDRISSVYHRWRYDKDYKNESDFCQEASLEEIKGKGYTLFPPAYIQHGSYRNEIRRKIFSASNSNSNFSQWSDNFAKLVSQLDQNSKAINILLKEKHNKWKTFKVGDVLEEIDLKLGKDSEPEILTCTETGGIVLQRERFAKRVATEDTSKYKVVERTDIVYNPYLLWAGAIDQCWIVEKGITSPAYEVFKIREGFDPILVGRVLKSRKMLRKYNGISVGTVQRRRRAPVDKFLALDIELPSLEEQKIISAYTGMIEKVSNESRVLSQLINDTINDLLLSMFGEESKNAKHNN